MTSKKKLCKLHVGSLWLTIWRKKWKETAPPCLQFDFLGTLNKSRHHSELWLIPTSDLAVIFFQFSWINLKAQIQAKGNHRDKNTWLIILFGSPLTTSAVTNCSATLQCAIFDFFFRISREKLKIQDLRKNYSNGRICVIEMPWPRLITSAGCCAPSRFANFWFFTGFLLLRILLVLSSF
jgi:hypothetical protein